jgi:hypothetical protein
VELAKDDLDPSTDHRVACLTRHCTIETKEGIARVDFTLEGARLRHPIVLARVPRPYCRIHADKDAETSRGKALVRAEERADEVCFRLYPIPVAEPLTYRWSFSISAACPLDARDLAVLLPRCGELGQGPIAYRAYRVRFPCDKLVLQLDFSTRDASWLEGANLLVLEPVAPGDKEQVVQDPTSQFKRDGLHLEAVFPNPSRERRYALYYQPRDKGLTTLGGETVMADHLISVCRSALSDTPSPLSRALSDSLLKILSKRFAVERDDLDVNLLGQILDVKEQRLLTCFGLFPLDQWGLSFKYGEGIAGHAVRTGSNLGYMHGNDEKALIFQPELTPGVANASPPSWVICIPLLPAPDMAPIGVVSLSSRDERSRISQSLRVIAALASRHPPASQKNQSPIRQLSAEINLAFWSTFAEHAHEGALEKLIEPCLASWSSAAGQNTVQVEAEAPLPSSKRTSRAPASESRSTAPDGGAARGDSDRPFVPRPSGIFAAKASRVSVIISHAHEDKELAKKLVACLQACVSLSDQSFLCTSIRELSVPLGAQWARDLKGHLQGADVVVALLTKKALSSAWVQRELDAAWALDKQILCLLGSGVTRKTLPELLRGHHVTRLTRPDCIPGVVEVIAKHCACDRLDRRRQDEASEVFGEYVKAFGKRRQMS